MKIFTGLVFLSLCWFYSFGELSVGDKASKIIEELGEPSGKIDLGTRVVYSYPEGSIHVKDGVIVQLSEDFNKPSNEFTRNTSDGQQIQLTREDPDLISVADDVSNPAGNENQPLWLEDADQAFSHSKQSGKPVLILFTGSDWCSWCQRMEREIFATKTFQTGASEAFVLLKLEYPKKTIQNEHIRQQNLGLKEKWEVQGFPTLIVIDAENNELGRTGYNGMVPSQYMEHLLSFTHVSFEESEGELTQKVRNLLGDDFADNLEGLDILDSISLNAINLSIKLMLASFLVFYVVRRIMKR